VSSSYQLSTTHPHSKIVKRFDNCVRNMFKNLSIDWECGWDDYNGTSAIDDLIEESEKDCRINSFLFNKYKVQCFELIQALVILPLQCQSYDDLSLSYSTFLKEFIKFEDNIENTTHLFYILKVIVDSAREIKDLYLNNDTRSEAISKFRHDISDVIESITKFCNIKCVHYEKMLCALYMFSNNASGFFYHHIKRRYQIKLDEYNNLPVKNIKDILYVLYCNCTDNYEYNKDTIIQVFDIQSKRNTEFKLTTCDIKKINNSEYYMKSELLKNIYNVFIHDDSSQSEYELSENDLLINN
jgi:ribosomal protein S17E